jgi:hypothetical protein
MSGALYLEHLTEGDVTLLAGLLEGGSVEERRAALLREPDRILGALRDPALYTALFRGGAGEVFLHASPFLAFATLVHRAARDLDHAGFVQEWIGPRQRIPVFDVGGLREFAADPVRRLFLAELLASYTRVSSGSIIFRTARGWRRRRFSELDPIRLLELLELAPPQERPAIQRRLGDLALFLTGVFPDHAGGTRLGLGFDPQSPLALLERLGRDAYRSAWQAAGSQRRGTARVLEEVASDGFGRARRVLNFLTDRYLFPVRDHWFPTAA